MFYTTYLPIGIEPIAGPLNIGTPAPMAGPMGTGWTGAIPLAIVGLFSPVAEIFTADPYRG